MIFPRLLSRSQAQPPPPSRRRTLPGLALLLALCPLSGVLLADAPTEEAIKAMLASDQVDEAVTSARARVAAMPTDPDARVLLANVLLRKAASVASVLPDGSASPIPMEAAQTIIAELESAAQMAPARKDICLGMIDIWVAAERNEEIIAQIGRCAAAFPADPGMMNGLMDYGIESQSRSDPLAHRILETVYKGYAQHPSAILAWSSFLLAQDDMDGAAKILEAAEAKGISSIEIFEALGDVRVFKLDFQGSLNYYVKASSLDTTNVPMRLKWATVLHLTDPRGARLLMEPLVQGADKPAAMRLGKDGSIQTVSRIERLVNSFSRALNNPTFTAEDAQVLASTFWQSGLRAEALVETEIALAKDPLHLEAMMLRAEIFSKSGLYKEAHQALERAESVFGDAKDRTFSYGKDEVIAARAAAQGRMGRHEDALATYKRTSDPARYAYPMGLIAERLGRVDEARSLLQQVIASGRNPSEIEAAKSRLSQDIYRKKP